DSKNADAATRHGRRADRRLPLACFGCRTVHHRPDHLRRRRLDGDLSGVCVCAGPAAASCNGRDASTRLKTNGRRHDRGGGCMSIDLMDMYFQPMREELTRFGFKELRTPDDVDAAMKDDDVTRLVVINSMCG